MNKFILLMKMKHHQNNKLNRTAKRNRIRVKVRNQSQANKNKVNKSLKKSLKKKEKNLKWCCQHAHSIRFHIFVRDIIKKLLRGDNDGQMDCCVRMI